MLKLEEPFPEDIARLIVHELVADNASLQNVALISPLFLAVCRSHIFHSLNINIGHTGAIKDLQMLLTAIGDSKRGKQLAISVIGFQISDHEGAVPQPMHAEHDLRDVDTAHAQNERVSMKMSFRNTKQYLDKILPMLTNIRHFSLSFGRWIVPYHRLSPIIRGMLRRSTLQRLHLRGIEKLPEILSARLLSIEEVSLSRCIFYEDPCSEVERPKNIALRSLRFEPFGDARGRDTANTSSPYPLNHWKEMGVDALNLNELTITLSSWASIIEVVPILDTFKHSVTSLSMHTEFLGLATNGPLQMMSSRPIFTILQGCYRNGDLTCCYPSDYLFPWEAKDNILNLYELLDEASPNMPFEERFDDGWFTRAMSSLSFFVTKSFTALRILDFSVSYWHYMMMGKENEELAWVRDILANIPFSTASVLQEIRVKIHIQTAHCSQNQDVALSLDEYEGWSILNEELCDEKWNGLKKVTFIISTRMVCSVEIMNAWTQVISDIQNGPLADLNKRGILDMEFAISKR